MSFSITNNSATAVVTAISTASSTYGTFTISSGSFPLLSGQTISGTNTLISNLKGSPYGTIQLFLDSGDAQIEVYINSTLYSALAYSSGIASIQVPILQTSDTISINIDEADLPVPSATPAASVTPTPTVTATNTPTPSITPSMTPTPSAIMDTPATLNALWWIDFTDAGTLTIDSGCVKEAVDKIGSIPFTATTGQGPNYDATGYLGVSGTARTNAVALQNGEGQFPLAFSAWTWFVNFYDDGVTQTGGKITRLYDYTQAVEFGFMRDEGAGTAAWRFRAYSTGGSNNVSVDVNPTLSAWTQVAIRAYQDGANIKIEAWENGSIIGQNTLNSNTIFVSQGNQFQLMFDGGIDFCTEQFLFDRKLTDGQMTSMFNYLSNKY